MLVFAATPVAPFVGVREFGLGSTLAFRATDLRQAGGFEAIRDYLYARMRGVRDGAEHSKHPSSQAALHEIRDALDRTAQALKSLAERR